MCRIYHEANFTGFEWFRFNYPIEAKCLAQAVCKDARFIKEFLEILSIFLAKPLVNEYSHRMLSRDV